LAKCKVTSPALCAKPAMGRVSAIRAAAPSLMREYARLQFETVTEKGVFKTISLIGNRIAMVGMMAIDQCFA
jgi:hypothetical protein